MVLEDVRNIIYFVLYIFLFYGVVIKDWRLKIDKFYTVVRRILDLTFLTVVLRRSDKDTMLPIRCVSSEAKHIRRGRFPVWHQTFA